MPRNLWHHLGSNSRTTSTTTVTFQGILTAKNALRGSTMPACTSTIYLSVAIFKPPLTTSKKTTCRLLHTTLHFAFLFFHLPIFHFDLTFFFKTIYYWQLLFIKKIMKLGTQKRIVGNLFNFWFRTVLKLELETD